jgi:acid phosphatase
MKSTSTISAAAVLLVAPSVYASLINYPPIPEDLTTPYQQRLAVYGPQGG